MPFPSDAAEQTRLFAEARSLANMGVYVWDILNNQLTLSGELYKIFGVKPKEFDTSLENCLRRVHDDDRELVAQTIEKTIAERGSYRLEKRIVRPDDSIRYLDSRGRVILNDSGEPTHLTGICLDITERKEAQAELATEREKLAERVQERTKELRRANVELARANRLKDEFLANMSHELRTPLTSILGSTEMLLEGLQGGLNDDQLQTLRIVHHSGRHLLDLINDLLDLAKIDAGKLELQPSQVDVKALCRSAVDLVRPMAEGKRVRLDYHIERDVDFAWADERRMKQVLVNLLSNAIKFTPERGEVRLCVRHCYTENTLCFTVSDTGVGIAEEDRVRLFRPFVQLERGQSEAHQGTGLGLALVQRMVELHRGRVDVTSEVGVGSQFKVVLPIDREKLASAREETSTGASPTLSDSDKEAVILVVDDSSAITSFIVAALSSQGHRVIPALSASQALVKLEEHPPDMILTDFHMPNGDGIELLRQIRERETGPRVPAIVLTGDADQLHGYDHEELGIVACLTKPIDLDALREAVRKHLA